MSDLTFMKKERLIWMLEYLYSAKLCLITCFFAEKDTEVTIISPETADSATHEKEINQRFNDLK